MTKKINNQISKQLLMPNINKFNDLPIQILDSDEEDIDESIDRLSNVESESVYDSDLGSTDPDDSQNEEDGDEDDEFEQQSSEEGSDNEFDGDEDEDYDEDELEMEKNMQNIESKARDWNQVGIIREKTLKSERANGELQKQQFLNVDDLSSDDEEAQGNTIGRIPLHWYDAYDHIGYNHQGDKVVKRQGKDRIDLALQAHDDPTARRTVYDMYNDREVVLTERDMEILRRIQAGAFAHPEHDANPDYVDYESSIKEIMPISGADEPKRRFLPSKWEMMRVMKIVKAIKEGRYIDSKTAHQNLILKNKSKSDYMIWNDQEDEILAESQKYKFHLPAPKMPLPGHEESYNPPEEYLLTKEELKQQEDLDEKDRIYKNFIPKKFSSLRHVPGYENFIKERFERCLDLYLCPRKLKKRLNIDPNTLIPKLPKPRELKPFPNSLAIQYLGHKKAIRSISISPDGQFIASASDDGSVRIWEVDSCYCRHIWYLQELDKSKNFEPVLQVTWNPQHHLLAAITKSHVYLIATGTGDVDSTDITESLMANIKSDPLSIEELDNDIDIDDETKAKKIKEKELMQWSQIKNKEVKYRYRCLVGPRYRLSIHGNSKASFSYIAWHYKGDYLATLAPGLDAHGVAIHQLSKAKTQYPFNKSPGSIQAVAFHPSRPFLFVVTQQHVKVFNLVEQKLVKKLLSGCKWISSIDVHPSGDHVIIGSYDRRVVWFDLDLSSTPYKTLKFHEKAIRDVCYHRLVKDMLVFDSILKLVVVFSKYPLMASSSDDGSVHIFHSMVFK